MGNIRSRWLKVNTNTNTYTAGLGRKQDNKITPMTDAATTKAGVDQTIQP